MILMLRVWIRLEALHVNVMLGTLEMESTAQVCLPNANVMTCTNRLCS